MLNAIKTYGVFEISDWFLTKESMQPRKLQKLVYYVQAWSNALFDIPLINDTDFEAWTNGPVSPKLREKYLDYDWNNIEINNNSSTIENQKVLNLLESVWVTYGDKDYMELEALSRREFPWISARGILKSNQSSDSIISNEDMKEFYLSIYKKG
ncbi:Panacea domain-containing protein [Companilactobacillus hulinensis]|uniref:Panacea domain-containing protein n=1 Tax=Companilactobacillus hulinensis TaxID=2486007 RepID=UPI001CDCE72A|nr:type II toxin-antitoxin system antitoxin SocA domain-containing protein [Companilactobacillus hulinensis]